MASLDVGQNLETMVLTLKKIGIRDLDHFEFVDPPPLEALTRAVNVLYYLGVLDDFGNLTELGEIMSEFPVDPKTARCLLSALNSTVRTKSYLYLLCFQVYISYILC